MHVFNGATTLGMMIFSVMACSRMCIIVTLGMMTVSIIVTFSIMKVSMMDVIVTPSMMTVSITVDRLVLTSLDQLLEHICIFVKYTLCNDYNI